LKTNIKAGYSHSPTFARFVRSLHADGSRRSVLAIMLAVVLLAAWGAWLFIARITLYEVTDTARVEATHSGFTVESVVGGRVVSSNLALGKDVKTGDVIAQLDTDEQRLQLNEERARLAAVAPQIEALNSEIAAEQQAIQDSREAGRAALEEARSRVQEADATARYSEEQARRLEGLFAEGVIAELELLRVKSEAKNRRAVVNSLQLTVGKLEREQKTQETERRIQIEKLLREKSNLEGQRLTSAATLGRLQNEIEKRTIRSPVTGQLGEISNSKTGAVVREGDKLGTIVPAGELKIVAEFPPSVLGRIHPGQPARMRLAGYPWTQYGSLTARVATVAGEVREGRIRVELAVDTIPAPPVPLQHGLPGTIEIEVEKVSPATILLRTVKFLARPSERAQAGRSED
jgi:membrane fusion protein (multidrug efflux system)